LSHPQPLLSTPILPGFGPQSYNVTSSSCPAQLLGCEGENPPVSPHFSRKAEHGGAMLCPVLLSVLQGGQVPVSQR
jgi:hypothetical protein